MATTTKVYGGRAEITFHAGAHYYTVRVPGVVDRLYQPGVTTVVGMKNKPQLVDWAAKFDLDRSLYLAREAESAEIAAEWNTFYGIIESARGAHNRRKDTAANSGSIAHDVLHKVLLARSGFGAMPDLVTPDDKANRSIERGMEFIESHRIKLIQGEAPRWSPRHGYIGTGDLIALVDDVPSNLDWKTGDRLYSEYWMQLAAYQSAYEEEFPDQKLEQRVLVLIPGSDRDIECQKRSNLTLAEDMEGFLGLLKVWRWHANNVSEWDSRKRVLRPPRGAPQVLGKL